MEDSPLIVTALAAGTSAGALDALKDDAKDKAKAAYAKLQDLVSEELPGERSRGAGPVGAPGGPGDLRGTPRQEADRSGGGR